MPDPRPPRPRDSVAEGAVLSTGAARLRCTSTGALTALEVHGRTMLLYPATELEDGLGGLWLRVRADQSWNPIPLVGTASHGSSLNVETAGDEAAITRTGGVDGLAWSWRLRLVDRSDEAAAAWSWDVTVTNSGTTSVTFDLLHMQDAALSLPAVVDANTYYPSQYLDLTPVDLGPQGVGVGVRQNLPGQTQPWCLLGCRTRAVGWATDGLQLRGRGLPEGAAWPALREDLPCTRLQHEHAAVALQSAPVELAPGATHVGGFFAVAVADHPEATSDRDRRYAALAPAISTGISSDEGLPQVESDEGTTPASPFATGRESLSSRALSTEESTAYTGAERVHVELIEDVPASWFTPSGEHVVTAAKQAAVLRPHGHIMRSLGRLHPAPDDVTTTVWMDGSFCSHLTVGNASRGRSLSYRRSQLGLDRGHGLRLLLWHDDRWQLLGTPSLWRCGLDRATWWYAVGDTVIQVDAWAPSDEGGCRVEARVARGDAVRLRAALFLDWPGAPGSLGSWSRQGDEIVVQAPAEADRSDTLTLAVSPGTVHTVGDDRLLFDDGVGRGVPVLVVETDPTTEWQVTVTPRGPDGEAGSGPPDVGQTWDRVPQQITLATDSGSASAESLQRLSTACGWFAHNALIHFLSPRGLEQYTGGAWGTRDVAQGPVGLLRSWAEHDDWRRLLLTVFSAQRSQGDWPQSFDVIEPDPQAAPIEPHGDVVYWPLLALGQFLEATGDATILREEVPFAEADADAVLLMEHVRIALDHVEGTFVDGTGLPRYGHGDWNDSLQPADPHLAERMVSTWTVILQHEALTHLAAGLPGEHRELADRAAGFAAAGVEGLREHLLVDGVLAGYGVRESDGSFRLLIHPRDETTGLRFSLLPAIHAIAGDLLTPSEATAHLVMIREHLLGPDGARLFDRPLRYQGGPMTVFQRAEASSFFGREIGIMYMHAQLRWAEALARVGDGPALLHALSQVVPISPAAVVPSAAPRQANTYASSSDAAFPDRYSAEREYDRVRSCEVPLEAGWRIYSSGPGLFLEMVTQRLLGVRQLADRVEFDPVIDPDLGTVTAQLPLCGAVRMVRVHGSARGHGPVEVSVGGHRLETEPVANPYRLGGLSVSRAELAAALEQGLPIDVVLG